MLRCDFFYIYPTSIVFLLFSHWIVSGSLRPLDCSTPGPSLSLTISRSLSKLICIELVPSRHLILCHPLLLLPSILPSIRVFSNNWALHIRWPKYWSFSFSISPSNEHLGLISFRMDWFDLLAVQGTLKSLLQHHSSKEDSQESSPTPQFKSINSLAFSLLYGPALMSIHDYWKNHSFD